MTPLYSTGVFSSRSLWRKKVVVLARERWRQRHSSVHSLNTSQPSGQKIKTDTNHGTLLLLYLVYWYGTSFLQDVANNNTGYYYTHSRFMISFNQQINAFLEQATMHARRAARDYKRDDITLLIVKIELHVYEIASCNKLLPPLRPCIIPFEVRSLNPPLTTTFWVCYVCSVINSYKCWTTEPLSQLIKCYTRKPMIITKT